MARNNKTLVLTWVMSIVLFLIYAVNINVAAPPYGSFAGVREEVIVISGTLIFGALALATKEPIIGELNGMHVGRIVIVSDVLMVAGILINLFLNLKPTDALSLPSSLIFIIGLTLFSTVVGRIVLSRTTLGCLKSFFFGGGPGTARERNPIHTHAGGLAERQQLPYLREYIVSYFAGLASALAITFALGQEGRLANLIFAMAIVVTFFLGLFCISILDKVNSFMERRGRR